MLAAELLDDLASFERARWAAGGSGRSEGKALRGALVGHEDVGQIVDQDRDLDAVDGLDRDRCQVHHRRSLYLSGGSVLRLFAIGRKLLSTAGQPRRGDPAV